MKLIITAGDGFAANHIWPMWPMMLQQSTLDTRVISLGKPAAGNEFIFNSVLYAIENKTPDLVIIQWAQCQRLDLVVDSSTKRNIALNDEIYYHNLYRVEDKEWWLSNASKQKYVTDYHDFYIGQQQAISRTRNYVISMAAILTNKGIPYKFTSTYDTEFDLKTWDHWAWHEHRRGMEHYSKQQRFAETRGGQIQPSTLVHQTWVDEILKPQLDMLEWK
jgi:hypothetical protein